MIHDTQSDQISQKQDERNIYAIIKTMCPPGYYHNGFMATHALGQMMYCYNTLQHVPKCMSCNKAIMVITGTAHCFEAVIGDPRHTQSAQISQTFTHFIYIHI